MFSLGSKGGKKMSTKTINIDGQKIVCERTVTILDAARSHGIYIPVLCYLKELTPTGSCILDLWLKILIPDRQLNIISNEY